MLTSQVVRLDECRRSRKPQTHATFFSRQELNSLLSLYSRRVSSGEWRDYAIDHRSGVAMFSIFRHTHERPLFTVAKRVNGPARSGEYLLFSGRERLASGSSLGEVLTRFERKLRVVS